MNNIGIRKISRYETINEKYAQMFGKSFLPLGTSHIKEEEISEIPILITDDGSIVCIPKLPEVFSICLIGINGTGKTNLGGFIIDNIFYSWKDYVAIVNDAQDETFSWSEPNDYPDFILKLKRLGQVPYPLPIIYLLPNSDKFEVSPDLLSDKNYVKISIPFEDVINNIEKYIEDLGASGKYLEDKKEELLEAETEQDCYDIIKTIGYDEDRNKIKGMETVRNKLTVSFHNLFAEGILNLSDKTAFAKLITRYKVRNTNGEIIEKEFKGNPFTAVMKAQCIPSFVTSNAYTSKHKDAIFSYFLDLLFLENSDKEGGMRGSRVCLWFDELTKIVNADRSKTSPETEMSLLNISTRGRNHMIYLVYATQAYSDIPQNVRDQTKYAIVFRHKNRMTTKEIQGDYGVEKSVVDDILTLKKFEAVALTTESFIVYRDGRRFENMPGPYKGMTIPSLHRNRFGHKKNEN